MIDIRDVNAAPLSGSPVRRTRVLATLAVILVAAASIRMAGIGRRSLWFDEMLSVTSATGGAVWEPIAGRSDGALFEASDLWRENTIGRVVKALTWQDNGNGVLHSLLLHGWIAAFGTSDAAVRTLSAVAGVVVVLMVYRLGTELFTRTVGYSAGVLAAVHPLLVRYSQEARSYALATALTLVATEVFLRLPSSAPRRAFLSGASYGAVVGAALLSHYLTAGVFVAHGALALARFRDARVWRSLIVAAVVAVAMLSVWMTLGGADGLTRIGEANVVLRTAAKSGDDFARPFTPAHVVEGLVQMSAAMTGITLQGTGLRLRHIAPLLAFPVLLALAGARHQMRAHRHGAVFAVTMLTMSAPAFSLVLAARAGHVVSFQSLYANFAAPYMALLLGAGLAAAFSPARSRASWEALTAAGTLAAVLISLTAVYRDTPWRRPRNPYADLARDIVRTAAPGDVVVFRTVEDARLCTLYLPANARLAATIDRTRPEDVALRTSTATRRQWTIPRYAWLARWPST